MPAKANPVTLKATSVLQGHLLSLFQGLWYVRDLSLVTFMRVYCAKGLPLLHHLPVLRRPAVETSPPGSTLRALYYRVLVMLLDAADIETRVWCLYTLYALYSAQCQDPCLPIPLPQSMWPVILQLRRDLPRLACPDPAVVLQYMWTRRCFELTVEHLLRPRGIPLREFDFSTTVEPNETHSNRATVTYDRARLALDGCAEEMRGILDMQELLQADARYSTLLTTLNSSHAPAQSLQDGVVASGLKLRRAQDLVMFAGAKARAIRDTNVLDYFPAALPLTVRTLPRHPHTAPDLLEATRARDFHAPATERHSELGEAYARFAAVLGVQKDVLADQKDQVPPLVTPSLSAVLSIRHNLQARSEGNIVISDSPLVRNRLGEMDPPLLRLHAPSSSSSSSDQVPRVRKSRSLPKRPRSSSDQGRTTQTKKPRMQTERQLKGARRVAEKDARAS